MNRSPVPFFFPAALLATTLIGCASSTGGPTTTSTSSSSSSSGSAKNGVIATLAGNPEDMVLDGAGLALVDDVDLVGKLVHIDIASGAATTLFGGTSAQNLNGALAADADRFYFTVYDASNDGTIAALPRTGGAPVTMASFGNDSIRQIVVNATHLCWLDLYPSGQSTSIVMQAPISGGPAAPVTGTEGATSIAVDDQTLYWISTVKTSGDAPQVIGQVSSTPVAGGPVTVLAKGLLNPTSIAVSGGSVYWINAGQASIDCGGGPGEVVTVPSAGGTVKVLAGKLFDAYGLAVSGDTAFFFAGGGGCPNTMNPYTVSKVVAGAQPAKIGTSNFAGPIVIDGTSAYVADMNFAESNILVREMN